MKKMLFCTTVMVLAMTACTPSSESEPYSYFSEDGQIEYFVNTEVDLYQESVESGETPIGSGDTPSESRAAGTRDRITDDWGYRVYRIARIQPLEVEEIPTQANDIVLSDDGQTAVIAYNTAGNDFRGGLQIINISNVAEPVISASIPLPDRDVNALLLDGNTIYFGGMQDPDQFPGERCFIASADITTITEANALATINSTLPSYSVTGIALRSDSLYVSVGGADGELLTLDPDTLALESTVDAAVDGIRDIAAYNKGIIALTGPLGSSIADGSVLDYRGDSLNTTLTIDRFGSEDYKATVEVYNNRYAILGLSLDGLKVADLKGTSDLTALSEDDYMFTLTNPTAIWTELTHTNSASYSGNLILTANGEYGFRVLRFQSGNNWDKWGLEFARVVGYASFEDHPTDTGYWSANEIVYRNGIIIIASGAGGVNLYRTIMI